MSAESFKAKQQVRIIKANKAFIRPLPFKVYLMESAETLSGKEDHAHDYMQIWYVLSGRCEHWINNTCNHLVKGNLFVVPPFVEHRINSIEGDEIKIIGCEFVVDFINESISNISDRKSLFDFAYIEPFLVATEAVKPRLQLTGSAQAKAENLLQDMLTEYVNEKKNYELFVKADLLKLLALISREYDKDVHADDDILFEKYRNAIVSAIEFIDKNYTEKIYLHDICRNSMLSQPYFSYLFKQMTGKTFVSYVNELRLAKATELLANSRMSITEVCTAAGFNEVSYFNRLFKKQTGMSPSQYRKNSRLHK